MPIQHKNLAQGGWQKLSLVEQLGNIGSEISRAIHWQDKDQKLFDGAIERALELFDLTLEDLRWHGRHGEIARAREIFCEVVFGKKDYHTTLNDLLHYFDQFAFAAQLE